MQNLLVPCATAVCALVAGLMLVQMDSAAEKQMRTSLKLTVIDLDGSQIVLTEEDLRKMPIEREDECHCIGETSGYVGTFDYSGVRFHEILKKAKAASAAHEYRRKNLYLVLRGTDGYQVAASWVELTQSADGRRAMIALDKDGVPLPGDEGKFRSVFPGDKYVGRSIKCIDTIEIKCLDGVVEKAKTEKKEEEKK